MNSIALFIRLLREGVSFAVNSLVVNRLRTTLSLLGITIGIFAIISVLTLVDSMERNVRSGVESLGNDVLFIEQMPWAPEEGDEEYAWWEYFQRPNPTIAEADELRDRSRLASHVTIITSASRRVSYMNNVIENCTVIAASQGYDAVMEPEFAQGRFFNQLELRTGRPLCVLGADVAEQLFPGGNALGNRITVSGRRATVIGVLEREGESLIGGSHDKQVIVPVLFGRQFIDMTENRNNQLAVKAQNGITNAELKDEVTGHMRAIRRLRPGEEKNFAINEMSLLSSGLDELFGVLNTVGFIIGAFSIIVGGFSIANIMFVSVRERTPLIGIQKALGAKRSFILYQFLSESVILAVLGGSVGLAIIFIASVIVTAVTEYTITLSIANVLIGLGVSAAIGLVSGLIPALLAARMEPVDAIRSTG